MLPITIDRDSPLSLTAQVESAIRERITDSTLHQGVRLPSSRTLAADLGVSRGVVVQAYEQLIAEGYLRATQGSGTQVATHLPRLGTAGARRPSELVDVRFDLRVDATSTAFFPEREWLHAYRHMARSIGGTGPRRHPLGVAELRTELAAYLGRSRGVLTGASEVVVAADFAHVFEGLCHALHDLGAGHIAVENPGTPWLAGIAERAGLRVTGVPVDREGIDVEALARSGARAVLITPVSQVPTGVMLSASRRKELLRWADQVDGWVVEHDRDGDLWFGAGSGPLALQRHRTHRVIYAGSTRGLLGPGLRLGWSVVPGVVAKRLSQAQLGAPDALTQLAFAHFVSSGLLDQHIRQIRGTCRARRAALGDAIEEHLPGARMTGVPAGTHAYVALPAGIDDGRVSAEARRRSALVQPVRYFQLDRRPASSGLVLGYGAVRRGRLADSVKLLASVMDEVSGLLAS
ncbi:PLP-dependent aminotransferase family protein [Amycolatopsis roodepoortensis]|uniref:aminotransferase-like domain-containing protein n=1 Tax=Amycolatopsis roodepoortensis TaxID=700274 RepID=UPI00214C5D47|nr:PLP-dependent aminotransferase family protein [Amycolatopsis roodepoortensis]UUV31897.1 PLP-dependent aminotransferase family protein [Amycolatopsis roodepoortensis]